MVDDRPELLNEMFHALADPRRREILAVLREAGELRVGDIADGFDISLNGVSKHLKVLERASLVHRRIDGRTHWLSARFDRLQVAADWLDHHRNFWVSRLDALADITEEE